MPRSLPVTLVTGFLGAGKTSLLHHLVSEHPGGHLALLVEKTGDVNVDARALRGLCGAMGRTHDRVEEFSEASDFTALLQHVAQTAFHERVLVEVSGLTQVSYWLRALRSMKDRVIQIEQVVCVVDLLDFHQSFIAMSPSGAPAPLRDFQRAQIEAATLVVLNKCDLVGDAEREVATRLLRTLNRDARIIETAYGEVLPGEILRPATAELPGVPAAPTAVTSEMPEFESVVYRAAKPFHPQRFWDWFNAPHDGLLRVKGLAWLATRNLLVGGISRTMWQNSCGAAGIWWAALPREDWPSNPAVLHQMQQVWSEPYGDRRQELVLTGVRGSTADAARCLNLCLLNAAEYALPDWRGLPDPFPAWDLDGSE